jgi:hypothetical protein
MLQCLDIDDKVDITCLQYYISFCIVKFIIERIIIMAEDILEIDDSTFDAEVLKSNKPVLIRGAGHAGPFPLW